MSLTDIKQKVVAKVTAYRVAIAALMTSGLIAMVSAADLNASVGPILDQIALIFVPLLNLILGALPLIITLAIIGFILGILAAILHRLKI